MNPKTCIIHLQLSGLDDRDPSRNLCPSIVTEEGRQEYIQRSVEWAQSPGWEPSPEEMEAHLIDRNVTIGSFPAIRVDWEFEINWFVELPLNQAFYIKNDGNGVGIDVIEIIAIPALDKPGIFADEIDYWHDGYKVMIDDSIECNTRYSALFRKIAKLLRWDARVDMKTYNFRKSDEIKQWSSEVLDNPPEAVANALAEIPEDQKELFHKYIHEHIQELIEELCD